MRTIDWVLFASCAVAFAAIGALSQVIEAHLAIHEATDIVSSHSHTRTVEEIQQSNGGRLESGA